jgi:hypothetical protein
VGANSRFFEGAQNAEMNEAAYAAAAEGDADPWGVVATMACDDGFDLLERQGLEAIITVAPGAAGGLAQDHRRQRDGGGKLHGAVQAQSIPTLASLRKKRSGLALKPDFWQVWASQAKSKAASVIVGSTPFGISSPTHGGDFREFPAHLGIRTQFGIWLLVFTGFLPPG